MKSCRAPASALFFHLNYLNMMLRVDDLEIVAIATNAKVLVAKIPEGKDGDS